MRTTKLAVVLAVLALSAACSKPSSQPASTEPGAAASQSAAAPAAPAAAPGSAESAAAPASKAAAARPNTAPAKTPLNANAPAATTSLPAGTVLTVRLGESVGSKTSQSGQEFTATLAEPVESNGSVLIPQGATARGVVEEAVPLGRFKGGARLKLALREISFSGKTFPVETTSVLRAEQGKGKRTGTLIGGGAGVGALIGGLAGGGKGAAIGALAGAGAGTAGAAYTGNKDIVLPAESALSFKLLQPVEIKR